MFKKYFLCKYVLYIVYVYYYSYSGWDFVLLKKVKVEFPERLTVRTVWYYISHICFTVRNSGCKSLINVFLYFRIIISMVSLPLLLLKKF